MKDDVEVVVRTKDLLTEESSSSGFLERFIQNSIPERKFAANVDEGKMAIHGVCGDDDAFDQLVRITFHDDAILAGSRLAFVCVAAQINRLAGVLRYKTPFHARRKTGAAAAPKARGLGLFDDVFWREFVNNLPCCLVATEFYVSIDFFNARIINIFEKYKFVRHTRRD